MDSTTSLYERLGGRGKLDILLRNFYSSLRLHPVLGPIFEAHVSDWPAHLRVVGDFWALQTGGPPEYRGRLLAAHAPLGLGGRHFEFWLAQWRQSCGLHFEAPLAAELIRLAEGLATRMRASLD
jgi:hemoglobin